MSQAKDLTLSEYQANARSTRLLEVKTNHPIIYPILGMAGEVGEFQNKVKKIFRDRGGNITDQDKADLGDELGDILWYLSTIAGDLDLDLGQIAQNNAKKLADRRARGVIKGSGDKR